MKKFLEEYRLEFRAGIIAMLGLALIGQSGKVEIILRQAYSDLISLFQTILQWLRLELPRILFDQSPSMLIGWLLVLLAIPFVIYRIRYRFRTSERWKATDCPKCSGRLQRIRRTSADRLLSHTLLPGARRYECANLACSWSGLRRSRHADRVSSALPEVIETQ